MTRLAKQYLAIAGLIAGQILTFLYFWFCGYESTCWWCLI